MMFANDPVFNGVQAGASIRVQTSVTSTAHGHLRYLYSRKLSYCTVCAELV